MSNWRMAAESAHATISGIPAADIADQGRRLADKFDGLVEPVLGAPRARELRETVAGLDAIADIGVLSRLAAG